MKNKKGMLLCANFVMVGIKNNDYDCARSYLEQLNDLFAQIPERW